MGRKRVHADDAARRAAQDQRRKMACDVKPMEFICIDGEGTGTWKDHRYVLLGAGTEHVVNPSGLEFTEIASYLYAQYRKNPHACFAGFFLSYDFTHWLKTLPEERARMLLTAPGIAARSRRSSGDNRTPFPVRYQGWEFDILGMKRFKLRPALTGFSDESTSAVRTGRDTSEWNGKNPHGWMYINDAGSFFQTSFLNVIDPGNWNEPVCTKEEYEKIAEGKAARASAGLDQSMVDYNALENVILARVLQRLDAGFRDAGVKLAKDQWFGPGQAAQGWMNHVESLPRASKLAEDAERKNMLEIAARTYYGGWFEIFGHGHVPGISWEYDINSAYPFVASRLPCLLHGQWRNQSDLCGNGPCIVYATVSGTDRHCGAMLHRMPDGCIRRPQVTAGYYWLAELTAAYDAGLIDTIDIKDVWEYEPCECKPPLRGLSGLYDGRIRAGKSTAEGKAYKLVYNSVYGKFAQSVGNPRYGNSIYASLITSGCRTMILEAIATHPKGTDALLMVATDGVYFTSPHPGLEISEKIGEWSAKEKENLTLFKPGVYWDDKARRAIISGASPSFKARGVSASAFAQSIATIDECYRRWGGNYPSERDPDGPRDGWHPRVTFDTTFAMVTAIQALQRNDWQQAGQVGHTTPSGDCQGCSGAHVTQDADPISKRHGGWHENGIYWSRPYPDGGLHAESTPYSKRFGLPDPDLYGITQDGTTLDEIARMLIP
jgi:hypothetical protein